MQPIHSGTTRERILRTVVPLLIIGGLAIAFLWDGYVGYATQNAENLIGSLGLTGTVEPSFTQELTAEVGREAAEAAGSGGRYSLVTDRLGSPAFEHDGSAYYLGPGGHLQVRQEAGRVVSINWFDGAKSDTDLLVQRWLGYALAAIGLGFLIQLLRVLTTRVTLSDSGLSIRGRPMIPLDAVRSVSAKSVGSGRIFLLAYTVGGSERTVTLDPYVLKECASIVDAICTHVGCANPIRDRGEAGTPPVPDTAATDSNPDAPK